MNSKRELKSAVQKAEKLHGHLGPFLVIGVRMGKTAKRILKNKGEGIFRVEANIPLKTPFSCVLDGIQATTSCTIGNQKLMIEKSQKEITAYFITQKPNAKVKVSVNQKIVEELMEKISKGTTNEKLAWEIAQMPEKQLFTIEKQ